MFGDLKDYINELETAAESTREFLNKLNGARRRLSNSIEKSEEQVKLMRNETKYVASLKADIRSQAIQIAKDELFVTARKATQTNQEFDDPQYRQALFSAIENDDTYVVRMSGSGFNSRISIDMDLNRTAGRLNMWASAIKTARRFLGIKTPRSNDKNYQKKALQASRAWAGIYRDGGGAGSTFSKTVEARLSASPKTAPFWQILNNGTPPSLASDRGGYPTPKNKETNFQNKAEENTNSRLRNIFVNLKKSYDILFENYQTAIEEATAKLVTLNELADEIRLDLQTVRRLEHELGLVREDISRNKLEKGVQLIREGVLKGGKLDITAEGSRKRKRLSIETIKELL
jgi:hypothetical protein